MPTHIHWIIGAYERVEPSTGNFVEYTQIDILADTQDVALKRAKGLFKAKNYAVRNVIEHFDGMCKA